MDIVRAATDVKDDGDEVEIPVDYLDTHTLRRLQAFVYVSTPSLSFSSPFILTRR